MMGQMQNIVGIFQNYYADGLIGLLTVAAVFFLGFRAIREKGPIRFLAAGTLMIFFFLFVPPFSSILMKLIGEAVYWRAFWIIPSVGAIAAAGASLMDLQKQKMHRIAAVIISIAAVVICGRLLTPSDYYVPRENRYAISQGVVNVAEAINEDAKHREEGFLKRIIAPTEIAMYIRVYDGTITQAYGRDIIRNEKYHGQAYTLVNTEDPDYTKLAESAKNLKVRYVVMNAKNADKEAAQANGFEEVYIDASYVVYFNTIYA